MTSKIETLSYPITKRNLAEKNPSLLQMHGVNVDPERWGRVCNWKPKEFAEPTKISSLWRVEEKPWRMLRTWVKRFRLTPDP